MKSVTEKDLLVGIGKRIKKCLRVRFETQKELAGLLGIDEPLLSRYLSGAHSMPYSYIITIARHFNVSLEYLLGERDKKEKDELWSARNKRIDDGYELIDRFDPHDTATLCGYLGDVWEGLYHMDSLHAACGIPKDKLGKWRGMIRKEGWEEIEKDIKNYLESVDKVSKL